MNLFKQLHKSNFNFFAENTRGLRGLALEQLEIIQCDMVYGTLFILNTYRV